METIAAISTPRGKGGIAVIRISGDEAIAVAARIFIPFGKTKVAELDGGRCIYGTIVDGDERIDDGVLTMFRAPRSYTGEDTVELSCHGGLLVTARVLEAALSNGAAPAGAGEFTKRAFLNGKITLTEAEAVGGMIDAKTDAHLRISRNQLRGSLSNVLTDITDKLTELVASVYAYIDYPDEDLTDRSVAELRDSLVAIKARICELMGSYRYAKAITEGDAVELNIQYDDLDSLYYIRLLSKDYPGLYYLVSYFKYNGRCFIRDDALGKTVYCPNDVIVRMGGY